MNREAIQALAKRLPRGMGGDNALLALDKKNDPFMAGTPTHRAMAEWFKDLWVSFGYQRGKHVRDIHYDIATRLPYTYEKHDGRPVPLHEGVLHLHAERRALRAPPRAHARRDRRQALRPGHGLHRRTRGVFRRQPRARCRVGVRRGRVGDALYQHLG